LSAVAYDLPAWLRRNAVPLAAALIVGLVVYSAYWTDVIFTNHTIPNSAIYRYPSFKTFTEGRWFADIVIWLFGGGGTQSFQTIAGIAIQAINGVLFAELFGVQSRSRRVIIALLVALHPAVLDYYSFTIDAITFTFGDTLALLGLLCLSRPAATWRIMAAGVVCLVLALAAYQPKLSVIGTVALSLVAATAADPRSSFVTLIERSTRIVAGSGIALVLYFLTVLATVRFNGTSRNNVSDVGEAIGMALQSYPTVLDSLWRQLVAVPSMGSLGLTVLAVGGVAFGAVASARKSPLTFAAFAATILFLPPAIEATRIINSETNPDIARTLMGYAYLPPFLLVLWPVTRWFVGEIAAAVAAFGFGIIATQENEFTSMKAAFDMQMMSRIVGRIEEVLPDREPRPLVVIGEAAFTYGNQMVYRPNRPLRPHSSTTAFIQYRQGQMANFFLGRDLLTLPTQVDVDAAVEAAARRPIWPTDGSVFMTGDVVVVSLEAARPGVPVTMPDPR
jgi:hypothetical protein